MSKVYEQHVLALRLSPTPLLLVDQQGTIAVANEPAERFFNYESGELDGQLVELLVPDEVKPSHPEVRDAYMAMPAKRAMGTGRDLFGIAKGGRKIPIEIGLDALLTDNGMFVLVSVVDISARKQHEAKAALAINAAATAMIMTDEDGAIVLTNSIAHELFGYTQEELHGQKIELLVPESLRRRHTVFRASYEQARERRSMGLGRVLNGRRKDGSLFPIEIGLTPIDGADGRFVMSTIQDISERQRIESEIRNKNDELKRLNEEITSFAYSMSHDLKAPLASLSGLLGIIDSDLEDGAIADGREGIAAAKTLATRLAGRIEQVLQVIRAEKIDSGPEAVSIREMVDELWLLVDAAHPAVKPDFKFDAGHEDPVMAPPQRLQTILQNLLSNACKYADAKKPRQFVEVKTQARDGMLAVTVSDNGIGIPEGAGDRIFDMFTRFVDDGTPGSGLGLALARKNVEKLNGTIQVSSSPEGSSFTVEIPLADSNQ